MPSVKLVKLEDFTNNPIGIIDEVQEFVGLQSFPLIKMHGLVPKFYYANNFDKPESTSNESDHRANRNWQINQPVFIENIKK